MARLSDHPPIAAAASSKPRGGARLLCFVLQAVVMAVAFSLFFLFAGVAILVLIHLFFAGSTFRRRRRSLHALSDRSPAAAVASIEGRGVSAEDLRRLPCFEYSEGSLGSTKECAVCLEGILDGELCRELPGCNHGFHMMCVDRWLVRSPACPICRHGVDPIG